MDNCNFIQNEELGKLRQDLQAAYQELESTNSELLQLTLEMEDRVAARTAELQAANRKLEYEVEERKRVEEQLQRLNDELEWNSHKLQESNIQLVETLERLKETQKQIIQHERLRALGQMASGIAHDFNNELLPVIGFSELLLIRPDYLNDRNRALLYLEKIKNAGEGAAQVVKRLREFYRKRADSDIHEPVDLYQMLDQIKSLTQPKWKDQAQAQGKSIRFEIKAEKNLICNANQAELREMMINLVFNAIDAISTSGEIFIRAYCRDNFVVIEVYDTGAGMVESVRQQCLEPFFSTKGDHGTGLGLAMVYGIIKRHEGTIEIESAPKQGTTFRIFLPVGIAKTKVIVVPNLERPRKLHVLCVDDKEDVREVIGEYLRELGHSVDIASDGYQALEMLNKNEYDLVVTDRAMPEVSGDQVALAAKKKFPTLPVIMITGFGEIMKANEQTPDGVDLVVSKPISMMSLAQAIAVVIRKD